MFVGNCNAINWKELETHLNITSPNHVGPRHFNINDRNYHKTDDQVDIIKDWIQAGYKVIADNGTVGWEMYYSGHEYDHQIIEIICKWLGVKNIASWISGLHPGNYAPWHYDKQDNELHLDQNPKVERYHIHISDWKPGHIFMVNDQSIINYRSGDVYKWNSWRDNHAGGNAGYAIKYTLNMIVERL